MVYASRHGVRLYEAAQQSLDRLVRKVQENMTGARVIKALSKTDWERRRFDEISRDNMQREDVYKRQAFGQHWPITKAVAPPFRPGMPCSHAPHGF